MFGFELCVCVRGPLRAFLGVEWFEVGAELGFGIGFLTALGMVPHPFLFTFLSGSTLIVPGSNFGSSSSSSRSSSSEVSLSFDWSAVPPLGSCCVAASSGSPSSSSECLTIFTVIMLPCRLEVARVCGPIWWGQFFLFAGSSQVLWLNIFW